MINGIPRYSRTIPRAADHMSDMGVPRKEAAGKPLLPLLSAVSTNALYLPLPLMCAGRRHLLHHLLKAETRGLLAQWEFLEGLQEIPTKACAGTSRNTPFSGGA